jgi:hypothetical protein
MNLSQLRRAVWLRRLSDVSQSRFTWLRNHHRLVAPDGRIGTYDSWSAQEGNPVHHLTDDEQDKLDDLIEGIEI